MTKWMITALALMLGSAASAQTPSFDCDQAETDDEIAICSDDILAHLDVVYAQVYAAMKREQGPRIAKAFAASVMAERRACGADIECIEDVLETAINSQEDVGMSAGNADVSTASMDDLIRQWTQANGTCRGSNDAAKIEKYCRLRENLGKQLRNIGLCQGNYLFDTPEFEMATILREKWIPCIYKDLQ